MEEEPGAIEAEQPPATEENEAEQPPAMEENEAEQPSSTEENETEQPPATEENEAEQPLATEENETEQPLATEENEVEQPPAMEENEVEQPPATEENEMEQPSATDENDANEEDIRIIGSIILEEDGPTTRKIQTDFTIPLKGPAAEAAAAAAAKGVIVAPAPPPFQTCGDMPLPPGADPLQWGFPEFCPRKMMRYAEAAAAVAAAAEAGDSEMPKPGDAVDTRFDEEDEEAAVDAEPSARDPDEDSELVNLSVLSADGEVSESSEEATELEKSSSDVFMDAIGMEEHEEWYSDSDLLSLSEAFGTVHIDIEVTLPFAAVAHTGSVEFQEPAAADDAGSPPEEAATAEQQEEKEEEWAEQPQQLLEGKEQQSQQEQVDEEKEQEQVEEEELEAQQEQAEEEKEQQLQHEEEEEWEEQPQQEQAEEGEEQQLQQEEEEEWEEQPQQEQVEEEELEPQQEQAEEEELEPQQEQAEEEELEPQQEQVEEEEELEPQQEQAEEEELEPQQEQAEEEEELEPQQEQAEEEELEPQQEQAMEGKEESTVAPPQLQRSQVMDTTEATAPVLWKIEQDIAMVRTKLNEMQQKFTALNIPDAYGGFKRVQRRKCVCDPEKRAVNIAIPAAAPATCAPLEERDKGVYYSAPVLHDYNQRPSFTAAAHDFTPFPQQLPPQAGGVDIYIASKSGNTRAVTSISPANFQQNAEKPVLKAFTSPDVDVYVVTDKINTPGYSGQN